MALLKFKQGLFANLPAASSSTVGNVFITRDTQSMYVDVAVEGSETPARIRVSDFVIVDTVGSVTEPNKQVFYFEESTNLLKKYNGTKYVTLNDTSAFAGLTSRIETLEGNVKDLEAADAGLQSAIDAIDAAAVDTTEEITVTTAVGNYAVGDKINASTSAQDIFMKMFCADSAPTVTQPTFKFTAGSTKYAQVGSAISQTVTVTYEDGSYQYGFAIDADGNPDTTQTGEDGAEKATAIQNDGSTGANITKMTISYNDVEQKSATSGTTLSTTLDAGIETEKKSKTVKASATRTAGNIPVSILKNKYKSKAITASTMSATSFNYYWYEPMYYGFKYATGALVADPANISATEVSGLGSTVKDSAAFNYTKPTTATATASWRQFFIAVPSGAKAKVPSVIDSNNLPLTVQQANDVTVTLGTATVTYNVFYINLDADYDTKKIIMTW